MLGRIAVQVVKEHHARGDRARRLRARVALGKALCESGYRFTTVSPATHRRVERRAVAAGDGEARTLRDVFGWSRPFAPDVLSPRLLELAREADVLERTGSGLLRSTVRFSSLDGWLFAHSAYPTESADAVFFGPDTYRYCDLLARELAGPSRPWRAVDVGCGSGAGGVIAAKHVETVVLADINRAALDMATVNATLAGVRDRVEILESDVLARVEGPIDLVLANPPFMADASARRYRDGGGRLGEALGVRIVRESLERLEPGGRLVLYTGAAIVDGVDPFLTQIRGICESARAEWRYREIDPDIFGEEIEQNDAYARVERIAAVSLVVRAPGRPGC